MGAKLFEGFSNLIAVITGLGGIVLVVLSIYNRHIEIKANKERLRIAEEERKKQVALSIQKNEQRILAQAKRKTTKPRSTK